MYEVLLSEEAEEIFALAEKSLARKISRCLETLEQNPRYHPNIKFLTGNYSGYYRYRIGDYRVIYQIDDEEKRVIVSTIVHRSKAYE